MFIRPPCKRSSRRFRSSSHTKVSRMKHGLPIYLLSLLILAPLAKAQQTTSAPAGLDSLDERRVTTELANRGMQTLLKRQFELNKTPAAQQSTMLTLISIQKLSDPHTSLTFQQRQDL